MRNLIKDCQRDFTEEMRITPNAARRWNKNMGTIGEYNHQSLAMSRN
ncbi:MAG: hypothetical protein FWC73_10250 [Defluviitaleaceae bacterium]|nr:hypothetical protein [Defluviitaleaceae bacterium]